MLIKGEKMIYLDNGATTHKKPRCVLKTVKLAITKLNSNPGRSGHRLSIKTALKVFDARVNFANTFNAKSPKNVIFTANATESLNYALQGVMKKGNVITSVYEHNSVLRVLRIFEKSGVITLTILEPNSDGKITAKSVENAVKDDTFLIVLNHISNVTGAKQNIYEIGRVAKKHKLNYIVDTAQGAGNEFLDMQKCNINCLCFAGHKNLYGIQGCGVLIINNIKLQPIKFGGNGVDSANLDYVEKLPESFEVGTLPTPSVLALNCGLNYVRKRQNKINKKILYLTKYLIENIEKNNKVVVYSNKNNCFGVVSFNIKNKPSSEVVNVLDEKYGILCRGGIQCAPLIHKYLNTVEFGGAVRISISYFNKKREINSLIKAIEEITNK